MRRTLVAVVTSVLGLVAVAPAQAALAQPVPAPAAPAIQLVLPAPTGDRHLGTVSLHLVDRSRPDPWVATQPVRQLMVQIWYPAGDVRGYRRAPWVSPAVGAVINPAGPAVVLPVSHGYGGAPVAPGRHPVVLYSPGLGLERSSSTALVEDLASHGYVVVTIDHPHDAQVVEFPDGHTETSAMPVPTDAADADRIIAKALGTRVADTRFTLDALGTIDRGGNPDAERHPLPGGLVRAMDLTRVAMFGHSLGGAAAAQTMDEDPRVKVGVNLDGTVSGPVVAGGLDRPFLLLGSSDNGDDQSWAALWAHLRGPRLELHLTGSGHLSFTDLQVLLPQAGVPPEAMVPAFGTIDGRRAVTVERVYLRAFLDRYLRHGSGALLAGPSPCYPEMRFGQ